MLEILYDTATKEVRATNADDSVQGNFKPKTGQEVVVWDIPIPSFESGEYKVDLISKVVIDGDPNYVPIKPFDAKAEIDGLKAIIADHEKRLSIDVGGHTR